MEKLQYPTSSGTVEVKLNRDQLKELKHYFEEKGIEAEFDDNTSDKHINEVDQALAYWLQYDSGVGA